MYVWLHSGLGVRLYTNGMGTSEHSRHDAQALSERDEALLRFERRSWRRAGAKEAAVRATFGLSMTGYYQNVNRLIDSEAALAFDPILIRRLRRLREHRMTVRRDQARQI